ncbi:MAG: hypothetical protein FJ333_05775 [Sphingomonadales bacterium]|nr:hypothetical protein [Sphingomonadales bacterium]
MMFDIKNATLTLISDSNLFCSAYPSLIILGEIENSIYITKKSIVIYKNEYCTLYTSLLNIVHCLAESRPQNNVIIDNLSEKTGLLIQRHDNIYSWKVKYAADSTPQIYFINEINTNCINIIFLSVPQFNDLVHIISQLILPSLCLKPTILRYLKLVSRLDGKEIIKIKTITDCENLLLKLNMEEDISVYIYYYREILLVVNKLSSLYNPDIKNKKMQTLNSIPSTLPPPPLLHDLNVLKGNQQ